MVRRDIKTAVITGPTGAVGVALCEHLIENNVTVYAVCRPGSNRVSGLPVSELLHVIECDASNLKELPSLIKQADAFYHFAWAHTIGAGRNDMPAQIDNISYTIDAVRTAKELGCQVFIGAGSQAEYGRVEGILSSKTPTNPENGYGMAKLCAGLMSRVECGLLGMDHVWTRILSIYGPHDGASTMISQTIASLLNGKKPSLTLGEQQWDYLYASDVARAMYLVAVSGVNGKVYPIGSGEVKPLREYVEILRDAIDPSLSLGFGDVAYGPKQVMHLQADISELTEDTGFKPAVGFEEGIRKTIEWVSNN